MNLGFFLSLLFTSLGILTLALRNKPNPYVGVRFGYTYLSKEAWKKTNTFAGVYCIFLGIFFLAISFFVKSNGVVIILLLILVSILAIASYKIAKESYEKEDLRFPLRDSKPIKKIGVKNFLFAQLVAVAFYIFAALILWNKLPENFAIHFNMNFKPDSYADKLTGALVIPFISSAIIPLLMLLTSKEPMLIRFPVHGKGQRALFSLLTAIQFFIVGIEFYILLFNAGIVKINNIFALFILGFIIALIVWIGWIWRKYSGIGT